MKRKLFTQIRSEWRSNLWLAIELLLVSVILWYIGSTIFTRLRIYYEPLGFDYEHVYQIGFSTLNPKAPEYVEQTDEEKLASMQRILQLIEARPDIEAVAMGLNAHMYNGSNNGVSLYIDSLNTNGTFLVQRLVTPDFARVYRYHGINGETPEQLAQMLKEDPNIFFASPNILEHRGVKDLTPYIGRHFENRSNGPRDIVLKGILVTPRYSDFQHGPFSHSVLMPAQPDWVGWMNELMVRVKDNMDVDFKENFLKFADQNLRIGNYYITGVTADRDQRELFNRGSYVQMRNYIVAMVFLAINVFLGLLGTFWYRTQQRTSELAIRSVNGASPSQLFRRTINEGIVILTLITPLAIVGDWLLVHYFYLSCYEGKFYAPQFWCLVAIVYAILALMILLGTLFPALRASHIQPALALQQE